MLVAAALVAGCGGDSEPSDTRPSATAPPTATTTATPDDTPTATAPSAPSPPPDATATPTGSGEDQEGGGGDESEARVPVALTVGSDGTVSPATVAVPGFLALELRVRNRTAGPVTVTWNASEPSGSFDVGAGKTGTRRVAGVRPGRYPVAVEGAGTATVVAGAEPGP
jgi:hypothetical protein